jgi:hypothetical protein
MHYICRQFVYAAVVVIKRALAGPWRAPTPSRWSWAGVIFTGQSKLHIHIFVCYYGYGLAMSGSLTFTYQAGVAFVGGVYRDGGIAQHGLGARGGDGYAFAAVFGGVAHQPKVGGGFLIFDLCVGKGGQATGAPVYYTVALVNEPFVVQALESFRTALLGLRPW